LHAIEGSSDTFLLLPDISQTLGLPNERQRESQVDPAELLFQIVSDVTGYHGSDLRLSQSWERDLGIDRIKRRRIARFWIRSLVNAEMDIESAGLRTEEDFEELETLESWIGALGVSPRGSTGVLTLETNEVSPIGSTNASTNRTNEVSALDLSADLESRSEPTQPLSEENVIDSVLQITQEKTGYDRSLLNLDAHLESELGVDSIKQAQIAAKLAKTFSISFEEGLRLRDFPTLRHWVHFLLNQSYPEQKKDSSFGVERLRVVWEEQEAPENWDADLPRKIASENSWIITEDRFGVVGDLAMLLRAEGAEEVEVTERISDLLGTEERQPGLECDAQKRRSVCLIHLGPLSVRGEGFLNEDHAYVFETFRFAQSILKDQAKGLEVKSWTFVVGLSNSEQRAIDGSLAGFARTLKKEHPEIRIQIIEVDRTECRENPGKTAKMIWSELIHDLEEVDEPGPEATDQVSQVRDPTSYEVRRFNGKRFISKWTEAVPTKNFGHFYLDEKSILVISGGMGGLGFEIALDLARLYRPTLILLGRKNPDDPVILGNLSKLRERGAVAHYHSCDVVDVEAVGQLSQSLLKEFNSITGVIHAAGIIEDRRIEDKTQESFQRVYDTKVLGAWNLAEFAKSGGAKFFCAFSSVSGCFGNLGQGDYSAANSALGAIVRGLRNSHPQMRSFSIAWGPWDEVGMAASSGLIENSLVNLISPKDGVIAFRNELLLMGESFSGGKGAVDSENASEVLIRGRDPRNAYTEMGALEFGRRFPFLEKRLDYENGIRLRASVFLTEEKEWLRDHQLDGTILLPATFGIEIMVQAALAVYEWDGEPSTGRFQWIGLEDFKIHHSIEVLRDGTTLEIRALGGAGRTGSSREVRVILGLNGRLGFQPAFEGLIGVRMREENACQTLKQDREPNFGQIRGGRGIPAERIYGPGVDQIPLGPSYRILEEVKWDEGSGAWGLVGVKDLTGLTSDPWGREAAFHLASTVGMKIKEGAWVPRSIRRIKNRLEESAEPGRFIQAELKPQPGNDRIEFDFFILDGAGRVVTEIRGYQGVSLSTMIPTG